MHDDPYRILNINRDAEPDEIKRAFRHLVKKYHPDVAGGSEEKIKRLIQAYQQICGYETANSSEGGYTWSLDVAIDRPHKVQDLFDDFRDGFLTFFDIDAPEYLDLNLELLPEEARQGGRLRLNIPLVRKCRSCYGFGRTLFSFCRVCDGEGEVRYSKSAVVTIPPGAPNGWKARIQVDRLHLTIRCRILT